jgi:hypothetical protein
MTPLYIAVFNGQEKTVDLLLARKYGCDAGIGDKIFAQTPLHIAAMVFFSHVFLKSSRKEMRP